MAEIYYNTKRFKTNHSSFSGYVYDYDFNGYTSMTDIASRIASDLTFDKTCKREANIRNNQMNYKKGIN